MGNNVSFRPAKNASTGGVEVTDQEAINELKRRKRKKQTRSLLISVATMVVFLGIWQFCTGVLHLLPDYRLPSPLASVVTFIQKFYTKAPDRGYIWMHAIESAKIVLIGSGLGIVIGIPLGILMAWYKKFDLFFKPIFDVIRPIPPIAWIPVMVVVLGIGVKAKVAVIFLASIVSCIINAYSGIKQVNTVHLWVAQIFGASDFQMLRTIAIPSAMPMIFTGIRVALNAAWMALVAAELLASSSGLGYMIQLARTYGRPDIIIAGILAIGILGIITNAVISLLEKFFVKGGI